MPVRSCFSGAWSLIRLYLMHWFLYKTDSVKELLHQPLILQMPLPYYKSSCLIGIHHQTIKNQLKFKQDFVCKSYVNNKSILYMKNWQLEYPSNFWLRQFHSLQKFSQWIWLKLSASLHFFSHFIFHIPIIEDSVWYFNRLPVTISVYASLETHHCKNKHCYGSQMMER